MKSDTYWQASVPEAYRIAAKDDILRPGKLCAHCGQQLRGYAAINDAAVCHPSLPAYPDCYRLVTVYGEELGSRRPS